MEFSFQDKILLQNGKVFLKLTSRNIFGEPTYAFVVSDKQKLKKLSLEQGAKAYISYSEYGDVLIFGAGEADEEKRQMALKIALERYSV